MLRFLLFGSLLSVSTLPTRGQAVPRIYFLQESAYAQSGINTAIFRHHALLTIGSHQLIAYFAPSGKVILKQRRLNDTCIERTMEFDNPMPPRMLGDGHQGINLGYSSDGFIHLIWGCHGTPDPSYLKLRWPDMTAVAEASPPWSGIATHLTYPQFHGSPEKLLISFRRDSSPGTAHEKYDHCLLRYNAAIGQWQPLQTPLLRYPAHQLAYLNTLGEAGDTLVAAYTIRRQDLMDMRDSAVRVMNESFRVIVSRDHGITWSDLTGKSLRIPISALDDVPVAVHIPPDQKLINQGGGWLDHKGKYHFSYFRSDERGIPQIFLSTIDLSTGHNSTFVLTQRNQSFDLLGRGTQIWPLSRPTVFEVGQTLVVAHREGNALICQFRHPADGTWRKAEIYAGDLGNYEPVLDYTRLRDGLLTFYVQPSWQGLDDTPQHQARPVAPFLLELSEAELSAWPDSRAK